MWQGEHCDWFKYVRYAPSPPPSSHTSELFFDLKRYEEGLLRCSYGSIFFRRWCIRLHIQLLAFLFCLCELLICPVYTID